jgi:hypothetical protein
VPGVSVFEVTIGDAALELSNEEVGAFFKRVMG